jgi:hypothetical protein
MFIHKTKLRILDLARVACHIGIALASLGTSLAFAQDPTNVPTIRATQYGGPDRWENALDMKVTGLYSKRPSLGGSSPIILSAKWNRKYETQTFVGMTFSSMAQPINGPFSDLKSKVMTYYGGLNVAQGLFEQSPFRLVIGISGGIGSMFIRTQSDNDGNRMNRADYRFIEPEAFITLYEYGGLEFGLTGSFRYVKLIKDFAMDGRILGTNGDFSSQALGLTFRTQHR